MGLSKALDELRRTRLTLHNDVKWCLDMVKELENNSIESFETKEALLVELKGVLENIHQNI